MKPRIRPATVDDAAQVLDIYAPVVRDSPTSFELAPPSIEEMAGRISKCLGHGAWLACERRGVVVGYAYGGRWRERPAYRWSIEVSVYVREGERGRGTGRALYTSLLAALRVQGFFNAYAGITLPNAASVRLHETMGFEPVGVYRRAGYKFGAWHDVGWWQLALKAPDTDPAEPRALREVCETDEWREALESGEALLRD
ncbi:MAG TPA: arsinothricin resistance N-acetyltransferase ArsN1 family B [Pyrinomonadaceae bacterium]|jgi:phosphinothricin acetyltransferase|nr:arsinothricin resistance N-acetyltransferase ArsN1 family B [Pyrinomonadaceae bacterium]